ncbi:uncharacterized protein LOC135389206 [Ornithodoros turicata]|uniref:uncharacterized protein LOC135389206 n=1 Tax=Ornithodoros turicata TaxID=34597 RepID=UPI00313A4015
MTTQEDTLGGLLVSVRQYLQTPVIERTEDPPGSGRKKKSASHVLETARIPKTQSQVPSTKCGSYSCQRKRLQRGPTEESRPIANEKRRLKSHRRHLRTTVSRRRYGNCSSLRLPPQVGHQRMAQGRNPPTVTRSVRVMLNRRRVRAKVIPGQLEEKVRLQCISKPTSCQVRKTQRLRGLCAHVTIFRRLCSQVRFKSKNEEQHFSPSPASGCLGQFASP